MTEIKKITQKEWDIFIEPQFVANGFSRQIREALKAAFFNDIRDADYGEVKPFMGQVVPGITKDELMQTMSALRDPNSAISKSQDIRLYKYEAVLNKTEEILNQALEGNKESRWF